MHNSITHFHSFKLHNFMTTAISNLHCNIACMAPLTEYNNYYFHLAAIFSHMSLGQPVPIVVLLLHLYGLV